MSLQQQEIGPEACPSSLPGNQVAGVPENCNIEFGLLEPEIPYPFRVRDQLGCTMEKKVRRHQKINLALAIAQGEPITA